MLLLIGYGNPGRGDDGLGPALVERIARRTLPGVVTKTAYQLTVEHALDVAKADTVVFVDADASIDEPYVLLEIPAGSCGYLDSHNVSPASVMALAEQLFGARARGFTMAIAGAEFGEIREGLSATATTHLQLAEAFLSDWLSELQEKAHTSGAEPG